MNNHERTLEIFKLCERLKNLLGEDETIANLTILYERHPEMFENMKNVKAVMDEVATEPEIIVDATHSNKNTVIYKTAKD